MDLRGRKTTVLGLAREGLDLARFLCQNGARVRVSDQRDANQLSDAISALNQWSVAFSLGGHPPDEVLDADVLFVSPGVPQELPVIQEARRRGLTVSSATELLLELAPCPVIGITGSSGKTTTTALVGEMLLAAGWDVMVGGNIGIPLLNRLSELAATSWLVLELSSFQLEPLHRSPRFAAITNLTPNHLDRHGAMEAYAAAKSRIFRYQRPDDWAVVNADDPGSCSFHPPGRVLQFSLSRLPPGQDGAFLEGADLVLRLNGTEQRVCGASEVRLRGRHNLANVLTACAVASATGVPISAMQSAARSFAGVAHRLQEVALLRGVSYVDDSIATTPERSMAALLAYEQPVVLIAGGRDKHLPMDDWARLIVQRARHVVLLGEMAGLVEEALRRADPEYRCMSRAASMDEAVNQAAQAARPGDVVLLSPGGTSFDMFADFEARGRDFEQAVRRDEEAAR